MLRLVAVVLALAAAGCGGSQSESNAPPPPTTNPVDPATAGTIAGRVTFEGTAPPGQPIRMDSDPNCARQSSGATEQQVMVGANGALQNVFVYVKDGLGTLRFPVPTVAAVLDQKGCVYTPRVLGVQVGQAMEIVNSDPTLHNVHAVPVSNREFNMGYPIQGMKHTHTFSTREVMVPFKCDVHGWMRAWVGVLDHPYYGVTAADGGFTFEGLPPGTYTVEAWHESLGTQSQTVTIGASETKGDVAFVFTAT
ncbi:MAG: hypothetical protein FJW14_15720 [Acidimicrobiia bacterium]|nr:hypothetical protein [Acidimicrobiia bacterium]